MGERKIIRLPESSTVCSMTCCVKQAFKGKIISLCNADILLSYLLYDKKKKKSTLCCVDKYQFTTCKEINKKTEVDHYKKLHLILCTNNHN